MARFSFTLLLLCALCAAAQARTGGAPAGAAPQQEGTQISVEGTPLTGPFSVPQVRGGRLFLPFVSIARALGDVVQLDAASRTVRVRRQTGVEADFDAALNLVRENGSTVLVLSGSDDLSFPPQAEALMLPVEITSALLDVAIHVEASGRVVGVTRGRALQAQAPVSRASRHGLLEVFDGGYDYSLDQYPTGFNHNLTLRADGRLHDGRFSLSTNVTGATGQGLASLNTGTFIFERPNGQRMTAGDIGVANDLTFMSSMVRGVSAQIPVGRTRLGAFAGRASGGFVAPAFVEPGREQDETSTARAARNRSRVFDTRVAGAYATFGSQRQTPGRSTAVQFSTGLMSFDGGGRRGRLLAGGLRAYSTRFGLQADFGAGSFSGPREDGSKADGFGAAADISGTFNLRDNLTIQGHYTFNGRNFMTAQPGGSSSLNLKSLGVTWSPRRRLTASLTDTLSSRPGLRASGERFTTATFNLTPPRFLSNLFVSHTRYRTPQVGGGSYTLVNASKSFDRWHLFANASRIKTPGDAHQYAQLGARLRFRETDSLQISQTVGGKKTFGGSLDWATQSLLSRRVSLGAGLGYNRSASSPLSVYGRLNAGVQLPFKQTLQISYARLQSGPQLHLSLRGPLFFKRRELSLAEGGTAEVNKYATVSGRVYQDLNLNGRYDADVDAPQANVRVRVDGNLSVNTDREGVYRIANAVPGEHTVALDLLSVRADLTILGGESQAVRLEPGFDTAVDFRTARTGRVSGAVWLDANGNGLQEEDEPALADVRIVTGAGRDTLTNERGEFVVADLAPGLHVLVVDIKTLPDDTIVRAFVADTKDAGGSLQVKVTGGAETGNLRFAVSPKPPERKEF
ncbi:MAG TPA: hypothetical protein VGX48_22365 [Pyrinomonadaceae bacterium]|jgi:hypothetical protein|nr:hypothetical protein [Pyrinomonadaceae bacterium]